MDDQRGSRLESHHDCYAQDYNDGMDHMAVREWDQLEGDAKEKEKLSVGAGDLENHHETNMDVRK